MDNTRQPVGSPEVRREVIDDVEYRAGRNTIGDGFGSGTIELCDIETRQQLARVSYDGVTGKMVLETFKPISRAIAEWLFDEAVRSLA
jgi:hypothetical protein